MPCFSLTFTTIVEEGVTTDYTIEYNGLFWVGLDYYSIYKYDSEDIAKSWVNFTVVKTK